MALSLLGFVCAPASDAAADVLVQRSDAYVTAEGRDRGWTIGNQQIAYSVSFEQSGRLVSRGLTDGVGGRAWNPAGLADSSFRIDGRLVSLERAEVGGFMLARTEAVESATGIELRLVFLNSRQGLTVTRTYAVYPGTPVIETWLTLEARALRTVPVSDLNSLQIAVDGTAVTWVRGLEGPTESGGPFSIEKQTLRPGESFVLEATGRSTQSALPFFSVRGPQGTFFAGYMWSGSWRIDLIGQQNQRFEATLGLGDTSTLATRSQPVELPHAFFGVVPGDEAGVAPAVHQFIVRGVRQGRPLSPLVTYNGWFVSGTNVDHDTVVRQMEAAAAVGVELFELDAGWYEGAGEQDAFDFTSGLGSWRVDARKFPHGLQPISDLAHGLGMKFGLWVEPERVDLRLIGQPGMAREEWLAQSDGAYQPGVPNAESRFAQLDLGVPEARAWLLEKLSALIDANGVDYLKWDSNFWINNTRARAGRGDRDGNFHHVRGLYTVLGELRSRYPNLMIENCSGGGNRLDVAMLRYTDAGWMDDRTSPSSYVRHNLQGLTTVMPPAYLLSYLIASAGEPVAGAPDLELYARSRMPGVFGLSFHADELGEADVPRIRAQTETWKAYRDLQRDASAVLLTEQAHSPQAGAWDAVALVTPARDQALVYAYQNDEGAESVRLLLRGLDPLTTYEMRSPNDGVFGVGTGEVLMRAGIVINASTSAAHLLELRAAAQPASSR